MIRRSLAIAVPVLVLALIAPFALASSGLSGSFRTKIASPVYLKGAWLFKFTPGHDAQYLNGKELAHGTYTSSGSTLIFAQPKLPPSSKVTCLKPGKYKFKLTGKTLRFTLLSDPCNPIRRMLYSHVFTKA